MALGKTGGAGAVAALVKALSDSSARVGQAAAWGLGQLKAAAKPGLPALRAALADADIEVQRAAKKAIDEIE